ncbi:MAG: helix-turn-helix transcriptional regulator [Candidatus Acidiferrales bacterium]
MVISERLKRLREAQNLSQGDIQERTGLYRCYLSRLENGRTVPSIETLEKLARALNVPLHQLFTDDETPVKKVRVLKKQPDTIWGFDKRTTRQLRLLAKQFARMDGKQRWLILRTAEKINREGHL